MENKKLLRPERKNLKQFDEIYAHFAKQSSQSLYSTG